MLRGIISGIFWGAIVVLIVVGFASLLAPLPATVDPQQSAVESTSGSDEQGSGDIGATSEADGDLGADGSASVTSPGEGDDTPLADTQSAPQPQPETPDVAMTAPESGESGGTTSSASADAPVPTTPEAPAPDAPEAPELAPGSITSNPAQPAQPDVGGDGAFETPADTPEDTPAETPAAPAEDAPAPQTDVTPSAESGEQPAGEEQSLLKSTGNLDEKFPQHESTRLPTVDSSTSAAASAPVAARPFDMNAVAFAAVADKPMMSIVLIDEGESDIPPEALADFPYPLSIAVNTLAPDVAERVATYRKMGFEILAMVDLPAEAAPSDVEVALTAHLKVIPQAVAVMEGVGDGLQGSKPLSDQVTAVLASTGHGLLMHQKGLDTARKLASREGVPAATVFRDFDSKGQTASVMRRFLDQAAFKADQEGGVIMVGRLREETLSALLVWGLQDRAGTVALAPVTATIRAKQN